MVQKYSEKATHIYIYIYISPAKQKRMKQKRKRTQTVVSKQNKTKPLKPKTRFFADFDAIIECGSRRNELSGAVTFSPRCRGEVAASTMEPRNMSEKSSTVLCLNTNKAASYKKTLLGILRSMFDATGSTSASALYEKD